MKLKKAKNLRLHSTNTQTPYHHLAKYRMIDIGDDSATDTSKS